MCSLRQSSQRAARVLRPPTRLATLFFVEMWERFSYYGMAAILVLYLTANATAGGAACPSRRARLPTRCTRRSSTSSACPGGWLADRVLGAKRAVLIGGAIIAAGHFTMAFGGARGRVRRPRHHHRRDGPAEAQHDRMVGDLYDEDDPRRDSGLLPLLHGDKPGGLHRAAHHRLPGPGGRNWHAGFAAAGVGMAIGLTHYALDWHGLGDVGAQPGGPSPRTSDDAPSCGPTIGLVAALAILAVLLGALRMPLQALQQWVNWALVVLPLAYFVYMLRQPDRPVVERHRLTAMFVLFLATALWFAVVSQAGSTLNVFAEYDTQRAMLGFTVPAPWFQSINPVAILLFAPPLAWLWTHLGTRQPPTPVKFADGALSGRGVDGDDGRGVALRAAVGRGNGTRVAAVALGVFVVQTLGELLISPIGLSVATRLAPPAQTSQLMGVWFLGLAVGAALSGELAALYGIVGVAAYYGLLALLMLATGAAIAILTPWLLREMEGVR